MWGAAPSEASRACRWSDTWTGSSEQGKINVWLLSSHRTVTQPVYVLHWSSSTCTQELVQRMDGCIKATRNSHVCQQHRAVLQSRTAMLELSALFKLDVYSLQPLRGYLGGHKITYFSKVVLWCQTSYLQSYVKFVQQSTLPMIQYWQLGHTKTT